jgi:hypothetical protein
LAYQSGRPKNLELSHPVNLAFEKVVLAFEKGVLAFETDGDLTNRQANKQANKQTVKQACRQIGPSEHRPCLYI